jgi:ABC-type antimicrobial peptide transport system permease subunit
MTLGAAPAAVVRLVLARMVWLVGAGIVIGGIASLWAAGFVQAMLFGVEPRDVATFAAAAGVLATVSALAGWLPARRAAQIDPASVLKEG